MAEVQYLTEDNRRKYKIRKLHAIEYDCPCGTHQIYESDLKPEKLEKCWKCKSEQEEKVK